MKEYEYQRKEDDVNYAKLRRQKVMDMNAAKRRKLKRKAEEGKKLQAKMEISQPGDQHEQQADAVAKKIVAGDDAQKEMKTQYPSSEVNTKQEEGTLMAKAEDGKLLGSETLQTTIDSSKGGGQNLDDKTKSEMGEKLGADLSDVKIHTGDKANEMSEGINAKAFTQGKDIYFKEGNFNTTTPEGKELLAHELTHTQQQKDGGVERMIMRNLGDPPVITGDMKKGFVIAVDADGNQYDDLELTIKVLGDKRLEVMVKQIETKEKKGPYYFQLPEKVKMGNDLVDVPAEMYTHIGLRLKQSVTVPGQFNTLLELFDTEHPEGETPNEFLLAIWANSEDKRDGIYFIQSNTTRQKIVFKKPIPEGYAEPYVTPDEDEADEAEKKLQMYLGPYRDQYVFVFQNDSRGLNYLNQEETDELRPYNSELVIFAKDDYGNTVISNTILLKLTKKYEDLKIKVLRSGSVSVDLDLDSDGAKDLTIYHQVKAKPGHQAKNSRESTVFLYGKGMVAEGESTRFDKINDVLQFGGPIYNQKDYYALTATLFEENLDNQQESNIDDEIQYVRLVVEHARAEAARLGHINQDTYKAWVECYMSILMLGPALHGNSAPDSVKEHVLRKSAIKTAAEKARIFYGLFKEETKDEFHKTDYQEYGNSGKVRKRKFNRYTQESYEYKKKDNNPKKRKNYQEIPIVQSILDGNFREVSEDFALLTAGYNKWLMDNSLNEKDPQKKQLGDVIKLSTYLEDFKGKEYLTRVKAVFYPYEEMALRRGESAESQAVPLHIYYYYEREENRWYIWDLINPTKPFKSDIAYSNAGTNPDATPVPPDALFKELNHSDHLPDGMLYYRIPGENGRDGKVEMDTPLTLADWFGYIGLGLALLAGAMTGIGIVGVWGTYILAASSIATMTSEVLNIYDKNKHGQLDATTFALSVVGFITSFLQLKVTAFSRISMNAKNFPRLAGLADNIIVPLKVGSVVGEGVQLAIIGYDTAQQIQTILDGPGSKADKERAIALLISQATISLTFFVIDAKTDLVDDMNKLKRMRDNPDETGHISIDEKDGKPYLNIDPENKKLPDIIPDAPVGLPSNINLDSRNKMISSLGIKQVDEIEAVLKTNTTKSEELIRKHGTEVVYYTMHVNGGSLNDTLKYLDEAAEIASSITLTKYPDWADLTKTEQKALSMLDGDVMEHIAYKSKGELQTVVKEIETDGLDAVNKKYKIELTKKGAIFDPADWETALGKYIDDLAKPPDGYRFYKKPDGKRGIKRLNVDDDKYPRLTVDGDGKIIRYTGADRLSSPYWAKKNWQDANKRQVPADHELHHLASDNVVKKHPLYKEGMSRGEDVYDIDQASNLRALAKKNNSKVDGLSDMYPIHSGSHPNWDKIVEAKANKYKDLLLENPDYITLKDVPPDILKETYRRIEAELQIELSKIPNKLN